MLVRGPGAVAVPAGILAAKVGGAMARRHRRVHQHKESLMAPPHPLDRRVTWNRRHAIIRPRSPMLVVAAGGEVWRPEAAEGVCVQDVAACLSSVLEVAFSFLRRTSSCARATRQR